MFFAIDCSLFPPVREEIRLQTRSVTATTSAVICPGDTAARPRTMPSVGLIVSSLEFWRGIRMVTHDSKTVHWIHPSTAERRMYNRRRSPPSRRNHDAHSLLNLARGASSRRAAYAARWAGANRPRRSTWSKARTPWLSGRSARVGGADADRSQGSHHIRSMRLLALVLTTGFPIVLATAPLAMTVFTTSYLRMGAPPFEALALGR